MTVPTTVAAATPPTTITTAAVIQTQPRLTNLPTLSISGPSPPHEEETL